MRRHIASLLFAAPLLALLLIPNFISTVPRVKAAAGAVNITSLGSPITENFNTLISSGTATWTNDSTIAGWYHARTGTGTTIVANNGSNTTGNLYSYGTGTNTDRALGSVGSGNAAAGNFHWGVRLANETGSTITSLTVSYTGEQWRNSAAVAQTVDFSYRVGTGLGNALTDFTTGGTAVPQLNFTSPVTGGTASALDGNVAANRTAITHTITGLSLAPGQEILLRWSDIDHSGSDHGLAIDDLTITANGGGMPTLSIDDVSVTEGNAGTVNANFTVSVSSGSHSGVTFDISTADGAGPAAATVADNDYVARTETGQNIPASSTTYSFTVVVNGDTSVEPDETFFVNVSNVSGATLLDGQGVGTITNDDAPPPVTTDVVISQVYGGGGNSGATLRNDFIELFNRGGAPVDISSWSVQYRSATGSDNWQVTNLCSSTTAGTCVIGPGKYYLVQEAQGTGGTANLPTPDAVGTIPMGATGGKVALVGSQTAIAGSCPAMGGLIADFVGYGNANCFEGAGPTAAPSNTTAALRKRGGCFDSDNNNIDFSIGAPNPRNSAAPTNDCTPLMLAIHDIQGSGMATPFNGQTVKTTGIVTALKTNGFFLQALDASHDGDPATSEAIFVFTSSAPAVAVGDLVSVVGTAGEFFNLTQIESTLPGDINVTSSGNTLPAPVTLTTSILNPAGTPDQLERFEGMRMHAASLVSVAPTNEFGETFCVLEGVARPLREPGIEISQPVPPDPTTGVPDCCIPRWDKNPERIMIDSDGLAGATVISVTSNVTFSGVTGPLDFTFSNYKVLPETPPATSANMSAVPVPAPAAGEFTVASFNIENFNNDQTQRQKAALAIRDVLRLPDIIGAVEIFDLADLQALAAEIQSISGVAYEARLVEADGTSEDNDQDVGFLVKTSRIRIDAITQVELPGCDGTATNCNTFINPNNNQPELLNDRPPLVLGATVDPSGPDPRPVIVVVNHLRSFISIELVGGEGPRVRAKRKAQGEFLADLLEELQTNNPATPVISVGDYNAYQFSDGYTDPVSVIKGMPTADEEIVVDQSPDLVDPNFVNLTDSLPAGERYSFIFEGTPQALDHVIVNTVAQAMLQRYAIARNNADFPEVPASAFLNDAARPERNSDHDMPVAYFKFPPRATTTVVPGVMTTYEADGQNVMLTANVSAPTEINQTVSEGTVTFTVTTLDGLTTIGTTAPAAVAAGAATASFFLPGSVLPQALKVMASFSGGDTTLPSTGMGMLTIKYAVCTLYDPTRAVKRGGTYPIRIQLCDASVTNVSGPDVIVTALHVSPVSDLDTELEVEDAGNANPDNHFRFDAALGGYIYNLKTTGLVSGVYRLYFSAGSDPTIHSVEFRVK